MAEAGMEAKDGSERRVLAIDIGGTKIAAAQVAFPPEGAPAVEQEREIATEAAKGGEAVYGNVERLAQSMLETIDGCCGIGIGTAGVVDWRDGSIAYANEIMPGWGGIPLGQRLAQSTGLDVAVMGDVHAHALGEARWGSGRGWESVLCLAVGTGIGGAFVENGRVKHGAHGAAGHMGHITCIEAAGMPCACGRTGHLESVASGSAVGHLFEERYGRIEAAHPVSGRDVRELAEAGDERAVELIVQAGRALGEALGTLSNILDPSLILLSGGFVAGGGAWRSELLHDALIRGFRMQALDPLSDIPIEVASLGGGAPLIGAAQNLLDMMGK